MVIGSVVVARLVATAGRLAAVADQSAAGAWSARSRCTRCSPRCSASVWARWCGSPRARSRCCCCGRWWSNRCSGICPTSVPRSGPYLPFGNAFVFIRRAVAVPGLRDAVGRVRVIGLLRRGCRGGVRRGDRRREPPRCVTLQLGPANVGAMGRKSLTISAVLTPRSSPRPRLAAVAVGPQPSGRQPPLPPGLPALRPISRRRCGKRVTADAMMAHLTKLQEIADANDGNRALGTAGLRRQRRLRRGCAAGQGLRRSDPRVRGASAVRRGTGVTVGGATVAAKPLEFTIGTPPQGVTGPLVAARVEDSPGCTASDYDGLPVAGRGGAGGPRRAASSPPSRPRRPNAARWR